MPKRTVLYYPTISVPDGRWLRQTLLYADEIASIVPARMTWGGEVLEYSIPLSPEVEFLKANEVFRPIAPDILYLGRGFDDVWTLLAEFQAVFESEAFQAGVARRDGRVPLARMHVSKLSYDVLEFLKRQDLVRPDEAASESGAQWCLVEEHAAFLYMSLLAKYLADLETRSANLTVPGTDRREYQSYSYDARPAAPAFACMSTQVRDVLPVPGDDVPMSKILEFRKTRADELIHFRTRLDGFERAVATAESPREIAQLTVQFKESLEREVRVLRQILDDARLATGVGCLKSLINIKSPTLLGSLGVAAGITAGLAAAPVAIAGLAIVGAIEVGCLWVDGRNQQRAALRDAPFAYLYHAGRDGIVAT